MSEKFSLLLMSLSEVITVNFDIAIESFISFGVEALEVRAISDIISAAIGLRAFIICYVYSSL